MTDKELLPPPAVVVVGDFQTNRKHFAQAAWREVVRLYKLNRSPFGPAWAVDMAPPDKSLQNEVPRSSAPALYPIAVCDHGNSDDADLGSRLEQLFLRYDVWAVIAATTSRNTPGLLRKLAHSDVPVLLTVDSTLTGLERGPNVLRLTPTNGHQAQAIVAKLLDLRSGPEGSVSCFAPPGNDRYVEDLSSAVRWLALVARLPIAFSTNADDIPNAVPVACIGYQEAFTVLNKQRDRLGAMILSDGCYPSTTVRRSVAGRPDTFWCRPLVQLSKYASWAYKAVCDEWNDVGRASSEHITRGLDPIERLMPFIRLVRRRLEASPSHFKFEGLDNQRGAFVVDRILPASTKINA